MKIRFTKGHGKYDEMRITRGDVSEVIPCPKQGIIPHDMVHHVVEIGKPGFLTRVRDGEPALFQMAAEPESDGIERLVEVIQGDAWSGGDAAPQDILDLYQVTCLARECRPLPVGVEDIIAIRRAIGELDAQWKALGVGESLDLVLQDGPAMISGTLRPDDRS